MGEDVDSVETPACAIARRFAHGDEALADEVRAAIRSAVVAEREACAKIADIWQSTAFGLSAPAVKDAARSIAETIRSR